MIIYLIGYLLVGIVTAITCSFLWAFGGAENTDKNWRRIGVPVAVGVGSFIIAWISWSALLWIVLACLALYAATTIGYGIPDENDEGSPLGKFWYLFFNQDAKQANILTRATVGLAYGGSLALLSFIKGHLFWGFVVAIICMLNTIYWACFDKEGPFPLDLGFVKLNSEEVFIGIGIGICTVLALI